ncbi:putative flagellar C1a complex subunit C1a-32 [Plasmopara halstedii]
MCEKLMKCDFAIDSSTTLTESFEKFQSTLLTHSVNRSPNSVGIFCREEVDKIVDYVTDSYYRHFELYKCIFTPYNHFHLIQREINDIEIPNIPHPLSQGSLQSVEL